jgi:hypothetical protein
MRGVESLVGEELNAVSFVMDYVEFHFNGPVLRALTNPTVRIDSHETRFPGPGSRDALCALIGRDVVALEHVSGERIELTFSGSARLRIPLDQASYIGPEAAHFVTAETGVQVYE